MILVRDNLFSPDDHEKPNDGEQSISEWAPCIAA
jgi:hypothetical protein